MVDYFEAMKAQSELMPDGKRSLEIVEAGGKIQWNSQLFYHEHQYGCTIPPLKERLKHAKNNPKMAHISLYLDLEIPFSALLQQTVNAMTSGSGFVVKMGAARCHLADQFSRKTGREIALRKARNYAVKPDCVWNTLDSSVVVSFDIVSEDTDDWLKDLTIQVQRSPNGQLSLGAS